MKALSVGIVLFLITAVLFFYGLFKNTKEYMSNSGLLGPNISTSVNDAREYDNAHPSKGRDSINPGEITWMESQGVNKLDLHKLYPGGPVPLPEGELLMFNENVSHPACCGSATYSTSSGCICTSADQLDYINKRGGNRPTGDF